MNFGKNRFPDASDFLTNDWMNRKENIEHSCIYTFIESNSSSKQFADIFPQEDHPPAPPPAVEE